MKKRLIILFMALISGLASCEKEDEENICFIDVTENIQRDIHFNQYTCGDLEFTKVYYSIEEIYSDGCLSLNEPVPLEFDGIIAAQGVQVPYFGDGGPAYEKEARIRIDNATKTIRFDFILTTIDTFGRSENLSKSALVLLDGYDSTYQVIFNHEIIPLQE